MRTAVINYSAIADALRTFPSVAAKIPVLIGFDGYIDKMVRPRRNQEADDHYDTVREFAEAAFKHVGMDIEWKGEGVDEVGIDKNSGKVVVKVNPKFFRPAEVELLIGNPAKADEKLGWTREISFDELVKRMAENDLAIVKASL